MGKKNYLQKRLEAFKARINKDFPVSRMFFFGSRASGSAGRGSDIDLIIVSPEFRKYDALSRTAKMYDYWDLNYPVDFLCYSPEEFNKLRVMISIVRDAVNEGIEI